jgi:methionyl-tRNA synthetase
MELLVSKAVFDKGINVAMASFSGSNIVNKNGALERLKKEKIPKIAAYNIADSQVLGEYSRLQREAGIADPKPPAQWLIEIVQASRRLPNINTVVDSYNVVSAETCLSIGAHDLDKIAGNIRFVITRGDERYTPLGSTVLEKVSPGEYACMDDEKILCRLDRKQCAETKITKETKRFMVYVQGNRFVTLSVLQAALQNVCANISAYCGGVFEVIDQRIV